ncbi:MAG TPA: LysR family transcriptional regulator [Chthoniobacterales bacterium]|jgi:DNA-binding transcriptional LysR family regulator|nr:LysR family transcriptional regulator [Chthoniobacterales bacterium]
MLYMHEMHFPQVDLNLLHILQALLEERHVTRAGKRCFLSQSAMSRAFERLREMFKDDLLIRTGRTYERTVRGDRLLRDLENLLPRVAAMIRGEAFETEKSREKIRLALTDYASMVLLPALASRMRTYAPNMTLEVVAWHDRVYDDIESGRIDVALSPISVPASLQGEVLFEEDFVCVLGSQRKRPASRLTLKQYLDAPHAVVNVLAGQQTLVDRPLAELGLRRRVALMVPFFVPATVAILDTDLILTIPRRLAQSFQTMRELSIVKPPAAIRSFPYLMVWHPRLTGDFAQAWFREQVRVIARPM